MISNHQPDQKKKLANKYIRNILMHLIIRPIRMNKEIPLNKQIKPNKNYLAVRMKHK